LKRVWGSRWLEFVKVQETSLKTASRKVQLDTFDRQVIKNTVCNYYLDERRFLYVINYGNQGKTGFPCWQKLWKILKQMDFRWKRGASRRKVLMEWHDILHWHFKHFLVCSTQIQSPQNRLIVVTIMVKLMLKTLRNGESMICWWIRCWKQFRWKWLRFG
jgi:hypothetical protein